ncbi:hypothetical protein Q8W71_14305 [Methylobacterium sp. NEAU 140]|uniref:ribosome modulation factor n=1 Tax=Methylobacterium sp. NEAU 140 TaxID=3064945 RepID=UPI0027362019|nr:hypothetical protein [Methylobacterium sp. NEAU 140]MDP4023803.1 hypothetical protein [Methylobacterium sp. NEAU 140]
MSFPDRSPTAISDEGRHARERGDPPEANPYLEGSDEHATWRRGYAMPDREGAPQAAGDAGPAS